MIRNTVTMKKIDILNFITDFRKAPNSIKTYRELVNHLGPQHESTISTMLDELQKSRVVRETDLNGEKAYQVIAR
jgi:SOS-response transcriptional repressor LexA